MDKFESQFETLDVRTGHMDRAMAASTSTAVPEDEVEELMGRVKAKRDLDVKGDMVSAGTGAIGAAAGAGAEKARTAEAVSAAAPPAAGAGGKPDEKGGPSDGKGSGSGGGGGGGGGAAAPADSLSARLAALRK
jgi:charged multivesicular body protein 1